MVHYLHTDVLHGDIQEQRDLELCTGSLQDREVLQSNARPIHAQHLMYWKSVVQHVCMQGG